ncbi:MAG: hypothetical protein ACOX4I_01125 [Anaerovoracaceae bacterium]|jgi:hypothetical protein
MKYRFNGFLLFGLGMVVNAMAGVLIFLNVSAGALFTFVGAAFAGLLAQIIGAALVSAAGPRFVWGKGLVIISSIAAALSYVLIISSTYSGSGGAMLSGMTLVFASSLALMLGVYCYLIGARDMVSRTGAVRFAGQLDYARRMYLGMTVLSLVLGFFFGGGTSTISYGIGAAAQMIMVVGAALVSYRLMQLTGRFNGKEITQ